MGLISARNDIQRGNRPEHYYRRSRGTRASKNRRNIRTNVGSNAPTISNQKATPTIALELPLTRYWTVTSAMEFPPSSPVSRTVARHFSLTLWNRRGSNGVRDGRPRSVRRSRRNCGSSTPMDGRVWYQPTVEDGSRETIAVNHAGHSEARKQLTLPGNELSANDCSVL